MKKCKHCKEPFQAFNSLQKYCLKTECVGVWIEIQNEKDWKKRKKTITEEMKTTRDFLKDLEVVFNTWIRKRDVGKKCISCTKILTKELKYDAGHFYPAGSYPNIRFEPFNVHGQCVHCNRDKHGNLHEYRKGLINRFGISEVERLDQLKNSSNKMSKHEVIELISMYKKLIKEMDD